MPRHLAPGGDLTPEQHANEVEDLENRMMARVLDDRIERAREALIGILKTSTLEENDADTLADAVDVLTTLLPKGAAHA